MDRNDAKFVVACVIDNTLTPAQISDIMIRARCVISLSCRGVGVLYVVHTKTMFCKFHSVTP